MANRASADYPQIRLQIDGGGEMASPTPTFALAAGVPCDAILPEQVIVTQTVHIRWPKGCRPNRAGSVPKDLQQGFVSQARDCLLQGVHNHDYAARSEGSTIRIAWFGSGGL